MAVKWKYLFSTILGAGIASAASAQIAPPPVRPAVDENGVDVIRGTFNVAQTDVTTGAAGRQGLDYTRVDSGSGFWHVKVGTIDFDAGKYTVSVDGASDSFTLSGSVYVSTEANGSTLTKTGTTFTYTNRNGAVANFVAVTDKYGNYNADTARLSDVSYPDGVKQTYTYTKVKYCVGGIEEGGCQTQWVTVVRLESVISSNGYQLEFSYVVEAFSEADVDNWLTVLSVKAINNAVEYCAPSGVCTPVNSWPTATYGSASPGGGIFQQIVTDPAGRQTIYSRDGSGRIVGVRRPGAAADNVTIGYGTNGVSSITTEGVTYGYGYSDAGSVRTTTVTAPNSSQQVYTSNLTSQRVNSYRDELNRTTSYLYDANGRVTRVTSPEGNYTEYTYDGRGNRSQTRHVAKSGSGLADIVSSAAFPASCTNTKTCNRPTSTTNATGRVTDYTWDATHGGLLTATKPAPSTGATRPQTRVAYTSLNAYVKNVSGSIVATGQATWLPTAVSECQTLASCAGAADEVKTVISYGPQTAGIGNNLLPVNVTKGSGNNALTATVALTYDNFGNRLTVDGPLAGTADTTRTRYDAARQVMGVIGPDPDGAGALKHRAQRITYNLDGQVTNTETGNVNSQSDPDWAAMTVAQNVTTTYDTSARPVKQELKSGGTTYALAQTSYDTLGRVDCSAQRMDPAQWASQTVACTPQTTGADGADRVSKNIYDAASEVTQVQVAVGTADATNEVTATFNANGTTATVKDGENNLTTYEYDGFDRLTKTRYPSTTQGSGISSTTDYEQPAYDANSKVTQRRLRDGLLINYTYDNLNRATLKDLPGSEPDVSMTYDLLGRLTQASQTGNVLGFTYDALSRNLSQSGPLGSVAYQYDAAGRRTRTTWPDSFYVTYDYLVTGEVSAIRENGAASGIGVLGTYVYDSLGRRTSLTRGNGTVTSTSFDPVSRLSSLTQDLVGTTSDLTVNGFTYNPASQIGALTRSNDAYAWAGHYNVNRNYTVNGLNQMTAAGATSLSYDGRGNLTASGTNAFGYASENLLITGPASATLAYDPSLRLYQAVGAGVTTRFQYDGSAMIGDYNASNALQRRYVHGPGSDEPLVWYEGNGTSDRRWLHTDERGSVVSVSNASGTAIAINTYDEYGIPAATNLGRFQYTGQTWLPELGMYYYKARMYSPTLGRFMQTDPIGYGDGINLYNYVGSDPVNFVDPSGLTGDISVCGTKYYVLGVCAPLPSSPGGGGGGRGGGGTGEAPGGGGGRGAPNQCDAECMAIEPIVVTAGRTSLKIISWSALNDHYREGTGDPVCLSGAQFGDAAASGKLTGDHAPMADGSGNTAATASFYGTDLENSYGTATLIIDADSGSYVGFHDDFDYDMHGRPTLGGQVKTWFGSLQGGRGFSIDYNNRSCGKLK